MKKRKKKIGQQLPTATHTELSSTEFWTAIRKFLSRDIDIYLIKLERIPEIYAILQSCVEMLPLERERESASSRRRGIREKERESISLIKKERGGNERDVQIKIYIRYLL